MINKEINLNDLSLLIMNLVSQSCQIIKQFAQNHIITWKDINNPVTDIDYLVQKFIISKLYQKYDKFPIKIIGQQNLNFDQYFNLSQKIDQKATLIEYRDIVNKLPNDFVFDDFYQAQNLCIWIDPIDCTQGFINNRKYQCTILIGISYLGKPICGFIGHPFQNKQLQTIYSPKIYIGSSVLKHKKVYQYNIKTQLWNLIQKNMELINGKNKNKVIMGYRKPNNKSLQIINEMKIQITKAGGAGYKCVKVIKQQVSSILFIDAKTAKWDTCAGQAIILAMGGYSIKPNLKQIDYSPSDGNKNKEGFLFTLSEQINQNFRKIMLNKLN